MKVTFPVYRHDEISPYDMKEIYVSAQKVKEIIQEYFDLEYMLKFYRDHTFINWSKEQLDDLSDAYDVPLTKDNFVDVIMSDDDYEWFLDDFVDEIEWNDDYYPFKEIIDDIYRR